MRASAPSVVVSAPPARAPQEKQRASTKNAVQQEDNPAKRAPTKKSVQQEDHPAASKRSVKADEMPGRRATSNASMVQQEDVLSRRAPAARRATGNAAIAQKEDVAATRGAPGKKNVKQDIRPGARALSKKGAEPEVAKYTKYQKLYISSKINFVLKLSKTN